MTHANGQNFFKGLRKPMTEGKKLRFKPTDAWPLATTANAIIPTPSSSSHFRFFSKKNIIMHSIAPPPPLGKFFTQKAIQ